MKYFNPKEILSKGSLFNFCLGERGVGKTFNTKDYALKDFLNSGSEFVYIRRYQGELDTACSTFFKCLRDKDLIPDDAKLSVKKKNKLTVFSCNDIICGYGIALSTSNILKSTEFPNVGLIIFDEFLLDVGNYHYLKNEVVKFLELYETIARTRNVPVLFLGNAISINNPYFNYFDLDIPYNSEFRRFRGGTICIQYIKNEAYRAMKKQTAFGKLTAGTPYADYAIDNKFLRDSDTFIENKGKNPKLLFNIAISGKTFGVWFKKENAHLVISKNCNLNSKTITYSFDIDSHNGDDYFANLRSDVSVNILVSNYKRNLLWFENAKVKAEVFPALRRFMSY